MMSDQGVVVGIEHIPQLYSLGVENISKSHSQLLENKIITLIEGDGRFGYKDQAPYNCIHVGAGKICFIFIHVF
jgi:protein-L-isoaspartate(D-aspartate) O-methyltransferase